MPRFRPSTVTVAPAGVDVTLRRPVFRPALITFPGTGIAGPGRAGCVPAVPRVFSGFAVNHTARGFKPVAVVTASIRRRVAPTDRRHLGDGSRWARTRGYSSLRPESLARPARADAVTASSSAAPADCNQGGGDVRGPGTRGCSALGLVRLARLARAMTGAAATASELLACRKVLVQTECRFPEDRTCVCVHRVQLRPRRPHAGSGAVRYTERRAQAA